MSKIINSKVLNCRSCNHKLEKFMSFGKMPIANAFLKAGEIEKEYFFELAPTYCPKCFLFQLYEQPDPQMLFHENYAFFADTSKVMQDHFRTLVSKLIKKFKIKKKDLIVEIGNNDGGFVKYLADLGYNHLGIDPSRNVAEAAKKKGVNILNDFFNLKCAKKIKSNYGKSKVFLAANTLAHIPDINSVFEGIENLLMEDGIFVTEDPYQGDLFKKTSYDQIYDEHVFIFSITSIQNICKKFNLEIFDLEKLETAGGSMRYYICRKGKKKIQKNINKFLKLEKKFNFTKSKTYNSFKRNCERSKKNLAQTLEMISKKYTIAGYGATSKSTTIFNYCNINKNLLNYITDTTPTKINKLSPGMHIPIFDYSYFTSNLPDYCFLLAWNHKNEILKKEKNNFSKNGKWITHIPKIKIF